MHKLQTNEGRTSSALLLKQLQTFAPAYYGAIMRQLYTEKISSDVLLAAYADIAQKISTFDSKHTTLFAWGFRIVRKQINRKKAEMVLQEIFGCKDPEAYRRREPVLRSSVPALS